jgi:hypothetical protein
LLASARAYKPTSIGHGFTHNHLKWRGYFS